MESAPPPLSRWVLVCGALLRALLFACGADAVLSRRVELVTPFTSFLAVREAAAYVDGGGSPFGGDLFHQSPLVLALFHPLIGQGEDCLPRWLSWYAVRALFICVDLAIAASLAELARLCVAHRAAAGEADEADEAAEAAGTGEGDSSALLGAAQLPSTVCGVLLLNPYSLLACAALSTGSLAQLATARALLWAAQGGAWRAMLWLALASVLALHPILLLPPCLLLLDAAARRQGASAPPSQQQPQGSQEQRREVPPWDAPLPPLGRGVLLPLAYFCASAGALLALSRAALGCAGGATLSACAADPRPWAELWHGVYGWLWRLEDLRPNVGLNWYLFAEVFGRFREYFTLLLQAHPFLYPLPLAVRLRAQPYALATALVGVLALFRPYPAFGDLGFLLPLLPMAPRALLRRMRLQFVLAVGLLVGSVAMPLMLHMWLTVGSGNANFFYNQTLVYNVFGALLVLEYVGAAVKSGRARRVACEARRLAKKRA